MVSTPSNKVFTHNMVPTHNNMVPTHNNMVPTHNNMVPTHNNMLPTCNNMVLIQQNLLHLLGGNDGCRKPRKGNQVIKSVLKYMVVCV